MSSKFVSFALMLAVAVETVVAADLNFAPPRLVPAPQKASWRLTDCASLTNGVRINLNLAGEHETVRAWYVAHLKEVFGVTANVQTLTVARPEGEGDEGYRIVLGPHVLEIGAKGLTGARYAFQTLRQLMIPKRGTMKVEGWMAPVCDIRDRPESAFRGIHLCWFPETKVSFIERCIRLAGYYKMNYVVVETWGTFRSEKYPWWGWKTGTMTKAEIARLRGIAQDLGVTLIPQFNIFGHATMSRGQSGKHAALDVHREYQPIFEPYRGWNWCLSNPVACKMIDDLVCELHEAFGNPPYFHIGCDEANRPSCPVCRAQDYVELIAGNITRVSKLLESRGARAMMWHDMLLKRGTFSPFYANAGAGEERLLGKLPKSVVICDWFYGGVVKAGYPTFAHFREAGYDLLTSPWDQPAGTFAQTQAAHAAGALGVLGTTWHHVYKDALGREFVPTASGAWGTRADCSAFIDHWRQVGWDMNVQDSDETGVVTDQIPSRSNIEYNPGF